MKYLKFLFYKIWYQCERWLLTEEQRLLWLAYRLEVRWQRDEAKRAARHRQQQQ